MTKDEILALLTAAYNGPGSTEEGSFAGDVLRACADAMAELWSMEIDGLEHYVTGEGERGSPYSGILHIHDCYKAGLH